MQTSFILKRLRNKYKHIILLLSPKPLPPFMMMMILETIKFQVYSIHRIDLCQRLTVLQDSCKTHLCSRFCLLEAIYLFVYIFSCDIKFNIII